MRTTAAIAALAFLLACGGGAEGRLSRATLDHVSVLPKPAATLPLTLQFLDENGARRALGDVLGATPSVLLFVDYTCRSLCGPIVSFAAAGLAESGLRPGQDFQLISIGIDPKDGPADARQLKSAQIGSGSPIAAAATFLSADEASIQQITAAAGYRFIYDPEEDQFAHPAAAFVIDREGRITQVLSALGLDGADLRLALVAAGQGRVGTFADHIRLLCYGFDPAQGIYTLTIGRWLKIAGLATVAALAGAIALMMVRRSREFVT